MNNTELDFYKLLDAINTRHLQRQNLTKQTHES